MCKSGEEKTVERETTSGRLAFPTRPNAKKVLLNRSGLARLLSDTSMRDAC